MTEFLHFLFLCMLLRTCHSLKVSGIDEDLVFSVRDLLVL